MIQKGVIFFIFCCSLSGMASERKVRIEWEPMDNAEKYTLEVVESSNCVALESGKKSAFTREVSNPFFVSALETGNYCFRVHGVSFEGVSGVWSDYQSIVIPPYAPKLPKTADSTTGALAWEKDTSVDFYEVEVTSPALKKPLRYRTKSPEFKMSKKLKNYLARKNAPAEVKVKTISNGIPSPSATRVAFATFELPEHSKNPVKKDTPKPDPNIYVGLKPGLKPSITKFPPQPNLTVQEPQVWKSFYLAQSLQPVPVTPEAFKSVRSAAEREALRGRSIASDRITLDTQLKERMIPDFRLGFKMDSGFQLYDRHGSDGTLSSSTGAGIGETFFVDGRAKKRWGYLLEQEYRSFPKLAGDVYASHWLVSPLLRIPLDSFWETTLSFGLGPELSAFTFQGEDFSNTTLAFFGITLLSQVHWEISDRWALDAEGRARFGPPLRVEDANTRALSVGGAFSLGARYRLTDNWSLLGGTRVGVQRVEALLGDSFVSSSSSYEQDPKALWFDLGIYAGVSIDLDPTQPLPDSRRFSVAPLHRFRFEGVIPVGFRSTERNPANDQTYQGFRVPPAIEWRAQVTPSLRRPVFIQNDGRLDPYSSWLALKVGYQWSVMDRDDFWLSFAGGGALRAHSGLGMEQTQFDSAGAEFLFGMRKQLTSQFSARGEFLLYVPIYLRFGKQGVFGGANTVWRTVLDGVWHWKEQVYFFGGYGFEQMRYFVRRSSQSSASIDALSTVEHFLRFGVGLEF